MSLNISITGDLKKLDRLIRRLEGIEAFVETNADNIIRRDRKEFTDQVRSQLKETGTDGDGEVLQYSQPRKSPTNASGAYTLPYSRYKERRGGTTAYVDLYLSGRFHRSIKLFQIGVGEWAFTSELPTYDYLLLNYGPGILGVQEYFLDRYSEKMEKDLQKRVDKYLTV